MGHSVSQVLAHRTKDTEGHKRSAHGPLWQLLLGCLANAMGVVDYPGWPLWGVRVCGDTGKFAGAMDRPRYLIVVLSSPAVASTWSGLASCGQGVDDAADNLPT